MTQTADRKQRRVRSTDGIAPREPGADASGPPVPRRGDGFVEFDVVAGRRVGYFRRIYINGHSALEWCRLVDQVP